MKRLVKHFFEGLLFVTPIAVTVLICYKVFALIDMPIRNMMQDYLGFSIWGLGFLCTVIVAAIGLTLMGFLCTNILTAGLMVFLDRQFDRFPLIKLLHSSIKDLVGAFVGDKKKFDQPVLVTLIPGTEVKVVGFITRKTMESWGLAGQVAVYLPQSYNFAGNLIIVPRACVTLLDAPSGDVMTFVVSGGITGGDRGSAPQRPR